MNKEVKRRLDIQGECLGVDFSKRGDNDEHTMINIYVEDDEMWHKNISLSSYWIDDFIEVLTETKRKLENDFKKDEDGFGYEYKK